MTAVPSPRSPARRVLPRAVLVLLLPVLLLPGPPAPAGAAPAPPAATAPAGWAWPLLPRPRVVGAWAPPAERWLRGHRGVDLAAGPGAVVRSPADGTVSWSGVVVDRPVLTVAHGAGLRSSFEPVESSLRPGDRVRRGQAVGTLRGRDHCDPGACLHWGVRRGRDYLNPLLFVGALEPSVLLPVPADLAGRQRAEAPDGVRGLSGARGRAGGA